MSRRSLVFRRGAISTLSFVYDSESDIFVKISLTPFRKKKVTKNTDFSFFLIFALVKIQTLNFSNLLEGLPEKWAGHMDAGQWARSEAWNFVANVDFCPKFSKF